MLYYYAIGLYFDVKTTNLSSDNDKYTIRYECT